MGDCVAECVGGCVTEAALSCLACCEAMMAGSGSGVGWAGCLLAVRPGRRGRALCVGVREVGSSPHT